MEEIIGNIYSAFESLYGKPLSEYLWGYNCSTQNYDLDLVYNQFGIFAAIFAIVMAAIYYYVWNPVRHQKIKYWGLMIITGFINFIIAFCSLTDDLETGHIENCLLYNDTGVQVIDSTNIIMFGIVNSLIACILFLIISMCIKWWSIAVKHYPF